MSNNQESTNNSTDGENHSKVKYTVKYPTKDGKEIVTKVFYSDSTDENNNSTENKSETKIKYTAKYLTKDGEENVTKIFY